MHVEVTEEDILYSEQVLFGRGNVFDDERIHFIKNFGTIDVLAVPGSGKTTALLAKIIILSQKVNPLDGRGVLILSHTNSAVDLIRQRIGHVSPNIFSYPNFVGTVQSFVNSFLAIPFFEHKYGVKPNQIDAETYNEKIRSLYSSFYSPSGFTRDSIKRARYYINSYNILENYRFDFDEAGYFLTNEIGGQKLSYSKPRRGKNYVDYNLSEQDKIKQWLTNFKKYFWKTYKVLHFDDAYYFGKAYLQTHPRLASILQNRFPFIFVDEMQDMESHQIKILDQIFYAENLINTFQRIGDKNQAIFSGDIKLIDDWKVRSNVLTLNNSIRLSGPIAEKVKHFALNPIGFIGINEESSIPPRIILYNDRSITLVIEQFAATIKSCQRSNLIPALPRNDFKVIGWRRHPGEDQRISIKSYYQHFNGADRKKKPNLSCLCHYVLSCRGTNTSSKLITNTFFKILCRCLEIEDVLYNSRSYTKTTLRAYLLSQLPEFNVSLEIMVLDFLKLVRKNDVVAAHAFAKDSVGKLINQFKGVPLSQATINFLDDNLDQISNLELAATEDDIYEIGGLKIHLGTIHSVKGETHCATLYLETYFNADGTKSFESQRLINQFKGAPIPPNVGKRVKQSARMIYVGFSRPTHLLCVAIHNDRIAGHKEHLRNAGWEIDETLLEIQP